MKFAGAQPIVQVQTRKERELEAKCEELLVGREIDAVYLSQGQLRIQLNDGGVFTMMIDGAFTEVS